MKTKRNPIKDLLSGRLSRQEFVEHSQDKSRKVSFLDHQDSQHYRNGQPITEQEYHARIEAARRNCTLVDFSEV